MPRTQEYMSKIISGHVMEGESGIYHKAVKDTYVISIGKENIFRGKYKVSENDSLFEKTVVPMIVETKKEVPGNKMHWKFFELPRFAKKYKSVTINKESPLKVQWLDFLLNCGKVKEIPEDVDSIIKEGYKIMEVAKWSADQRTLYWKQAADEASEVQEAQKLQQMKYEEGLKKGKEEGRKEGREEGRKEGAEKAKQEMLKKISSSNLPEETLSSLMSLLSGSSSQNKEESTLLLGDLKSNEDGSEEGDSSRKG